MKIVEGNACLDRDVDIPFLETIGCIVDWHTEYYLNSVEVSLGDDITVGFYNWLDNADVYINNEKLFLKDEEDYHRIVDLMKALSSCKSLISK